MFNVPDIMIDNYIVSVVIPTKNRYATLFPVVRSMLDSIPDQGLQVVIQDNSEDNTEALAFISDLHDSRVFYQHRSEAWSIVENTEAALSNATGDFVTFIGDDDLVSPLIVHIARKMIAAGVDAVTYPPAYYWWPSVIFAQPSKYYQPGAFWFPISINRAPHYLDTGKELDHVLDSGAVSIFQLPKLYHGLVRREVLTRIKASSGMLVNGASPDMALAVALASQVRQHVHLDFPLTIYGASRNSGGGFTAEKKHYGRLEDQPHLPRATVENWSPKLPRVWSEYTIYPQTAIEVLNALRISKRINFTAFYAAMGIGEPHLRNLLAPLVLKHLQENPRELPSFIAILLRKFAGKARRAFKTRVTGLPFHLEIFASPAECMNYLSKLDFVDLPEKQRVDVL